MQSGFLPQQRIERFAEAVAGEGEAGFGFGEGQGEVGVGGFAPAEERDGIDFGSGELVAFARPAVVFAEADEERLAVLLLKAGGDGIHAFRSAPGGEEAVPQGVEVGGAVVRADGIWREGLESPFFTLHRHCDDDGREN